MDEAANSADTAGQKVIPIQLVLLYLSKVNIDFFFSVYISFGITQVQKSLQKSEALQWNSERKSPSEGYFYLCYVSTFLSLDYFPFAAVKKLSYFFK